MFAIYISARCTDKPVLLLAVTSDFRLWIGCVCFVFWSLPSRSDNHTDHLLHKLLHGGRDTRTRNHFYCSHSSRIIPTPIPVASNNYILEYLKHLKAEKCVWYQTFKNKIITNLHQQHYPSSVFISVRPTYYFYTVTQLSVNYVHCSSVTACWVVICKNGTFYTHAIWHSHSHVIIPIPIGSPSAGALGTFSYQCEEKCQSLPHTTTCI